MRDSSLWQNHAYTPIPRPSLFKIVDGESGNTVGFYHDQERALAALHRMVEQWPKEQFVLVAMDSAGWPMWSLE